jgi:hypothetical protein
MLTPFLLFTHIKMSFKLSQYIGLLSFILFFLISICICSIQNASAVQLTLEWDPVTNQSVAGYKLYQGDLSGKYTSSMDVGNKITITITNIEEGKDYCYVVTVYDIYGTESGYSNQYCYNTATDPDFAQDSPHESIVATVYEDAEDGRTAGWTVVDNSPSGATVLNVYDPERGSYVIQLTGSGTNNAYALRNEDSSNWGNQDQFVLEWSMSYIEYFTVYVDVQTSLGHRYLCYTPEKSDRLGSNEYVSFGLGVEAMDGSWHTHVRNLQADLEKAQPGNEIIEVNGLLIRGSGLVDDISLR